jgi:hypothetical protein
MAGKAIVLQCLLYSQGTCVIMIQRDTELSETKGGQDVPLDMCHITTYGNNTSSRNRGFVLRLPM